jgi:hypothetical protein
MSSLLKELLNRKPGAAWPGQTGETLSGLYEGQPKRTTERPTGVRLLKAFARAEITLTRIEMGAQAMWHITPLSGVLERVLAYLGLSASLYQRLAENSP